MPAEDSGESGFRTDETTVSDKNDNPVEFASIEMLARANRNVHVACYNPHRQFLFTIENSLVRSYKWQNNELIGNLELDWSSFARPRSMTFVAIAGKNAKNGNFKRLETLYISGYTKQDGHSVWIVDQQTLQPKRKLDTSMLDRNTEKVLGNKHKFLFV